MAISTYTELQAAVLAWAWDRNTAQVANAITLAHSEINLGLRVPFMEKTTDLTISSYRIAVPSDFAAVKRLWIDGSYDNPLTPTSPALLADFRANYSSAQPQQYAIEGDFASGATTGEYFVFGPDPGSTSYTGKLLYTQRLTAFSAGGDTNVVLARYPNLYLFGALAMMASFEDEDGRYAKFVPQFASLMARINMQANNDAYAGFTPQMVSPYTQ